MPPQTTIACLTPPGKAAIATLAIRGADAWSITRTLFQPSQGELPESPPRGRFWFGRLGALHRDDVVVSSTSERIEVHCHGGLEIVRMIQQLYADRGAVVVPWQAFMGVAAPLLDLLTQAPTLRTARILLDQVNGAWTPERTSNHSRLVELLPLGAHLVEPWKVVLSGAPNVGKSSLMNALAGYTRSIVAPTPGTTRDVVDARLAIDGWPVDLIDTAGIRDATGHLEREGIKFAHAAIRDANLRLWVLDGSASPIFPRDAEGWHYVINKTDLPPAWDWNDLPSASRISARTGFGLTDLGDWISRTLVPTPPAPGEAVPCLPEQVAWVRHGDESQRH